ncbi:MAG TPA: N-acetylmuramoyl-L-alanine amidase [Anaeromyxobacteraceae bacterium]|nr:N-acetylmuramoyl-L-alanine amidase [Anaeromyxobacteraceae bacterium]
MTPALPAAAALLALLSAAPGKTAPASGSKAAVAAPAFIAVVDPGHGGDQEGALSPAGDREKDLVLEIARKVAARLRKLGARVVLTRTGDIDVPLVNRATIANALRADLFVSLHLNSMPTAEQRRVRRGVETYFLSADATDASAAAVAARENAARMAGEALADAGDPVGFILQDLESAAALTESSRLAYFLHERLVERTGADDDGVKQAPFYVLAGARMPSVLLELGFLSHPAESARLKSPEYQERIAEAIADGISAWRAADRHAMR